MYQGKGQAVNHSWCMARIQHSDAEDVVKKVATLPALVTLANAFCGFLAIAYTADAMVHVEKTDQLLARAAWLILLGMVFDALDGTIARLTKGTSNFGAQLDSLSDIISFGVAPAFLGKTLLESYCGALEGTQGARIALMLSVVFVACAALRLARYNSTVHDDADTASQGVEFFRGLPTPGAAAAMAVLTLGYFHSDKNEFIPILFPIAVPVLSYLMVSRIPYPHFFNKLFRGRRKFTQLVQIVVLTVIVAFFPEASLGLGFAAYLSWGPVAVLIRRVRRRPSLLPHRGGVEVEDPATKKVRQEANGGANG